MYKTFSAVSGILCLVAFTQSAFSPSWIYFCTGAFYATLSAALVVISSHQSRSSGQEDLDRRFSLIEDSIRSSSEKMEDVKTYVSGMSLSKAAIKRI